MKRSILFSETLVPPIDDLGFLGIVNSFVIIFLFAAKHIYRILEVGIKIMVAVILLCFVINIVVASRAKYFFIAILLVEFLSTFSHGFVFERFLMVLI